MPLPTFSTSRVSLGLTVPPWSTIPKNAFAREDTIACEIIDSAPRVAYLSDLRDFDNHVFADFDLGAHRHMHYVDAFGAEVFGEIAFFHVESHSLGALDGLPGKKRDLAMPIA